MAKTTRQETEGPAANGTMEEKLKLKTLTSLQEKYSFYVDYRTEQVYSAGFAATKTEREMLIEDTQVLELICETIAMKLKSRIEREKKAKVRRTHALCTKGKDK